MYCENFKNHLKQIDLNEDEYIEKRKEYIKIINEVAPEFKNLKLKDFESVKRVDINQKFLANKEGVIFKLGCENLMDLFLKYDFRGHEFKDAAINLYEETFLNEGLKKINLNNLYYSEFKFFINSQVDRIIFNGFHNYLKFNPQIMSEFNFNHMEPQVNEYEKMQKEASYKEARELLNDKLSTLTEREEKLLRLYVGFDNDEGLSFDEIGKVYNRSREWARKIVCKAIRKMRHPARSAVLEEYYYENE